MSYIKAKLGKMRKPQEFVARVDHDGSIYVQSDKSTGKFDPETGSGILNIKGCYFHHLNKAFGAEDYQFPPEFVKQCKDMAYRSGDSLGGGVFLT